MKDYTETYTKQNPVEVIKETKHYSPEGRIYAKTTIFYNKEGVAYKIVDWVQNVDKSITFSSRLIAHFNSYGELKLISHNLIS